MEQESVTQPWQPQPNMEPIAVPSHEPPLQQSLELAVSASAVSPENTRVALLLARMRKEVRRRRFSVVCIISFLCAPYALMFSAVLLENYPVLATLLALMTILLTLGASTWMWAESRRFNKTLRELEQIEDLSIIPPLTEALGNDNKTLARASAHLLKRLLPRLKATDARLLDATHRVYLYRALDPMTLSNRFTYDKDLAFAILKSLEQIGNADALPHVQRVARKGRHPDVRMAAQSCLPFLEQLDRDLKTSQTLLRASSASHTPADLLLRPADTTNEDQPHQLLRAAESRMDEGE